MGWGVISPRPEGRCVCPYCALPNSRRLRDHRRSTRTSRGYGGKTGRTRLRISSPVFSIRASKQRAKGAPGRAQARSFLRLCASETPFCTSCPSPQCIVVSPPPPPLLWISRDAAQAPSPTKTCLSGQPACLAQRTLHGKVTTESGASRTHMSYFVACLHSYAAQCTSNLP